jgi:hypothetical protein
LGYIIDAVHASVLALCRSSVVQHQQQEPADQGMNFVYAVDYDDEHDAAYTSDEALEPAVQQIMTFSTWLPDQQQEIHHGRPCHHRRHQQHQQTVPGPVQHAQHAVHDIAAAVPADADVLLAAASHAWQHAQQVAARFAAADAAETAELVVELEASIDRMSKTSDAADEVIDRRWEVFDIGDSQMWSTAVADHINPARVYEPTADVDRYELPDYDDVFGLLPADPAADSAGIPDDDDIGFIVPEHNAANNMAIFGVASPSEVAAAAAAAGPGMQFDTGCSWEGLLEWLSAAPFEPVNSQKAAAVLLVGCTLMVLVSFLFSIVDLRAAVHSATAAAAAADSDADDAPPCRPQPPAGAAPLRTCKSAFGGCAAFAAAGAAVPSAADDLSKPLLSDAEDDLEAAVGRTRPSGSLPLALQKFYNPMHYQQLPDTA